jgi:ABC-type Mn2+/Zn2+ transport system permease subunit/ubiquinone/menaquinone biosynthesis C-methylase UbiE
MIEFVILPTSLVIKILVGAVLAALACSLIGVFIVHMKITSIGYCMSHAAFAGAALGLLIGCYIDGFDPLITTVLFTIMVAILLGPLSDKTQLDSNIVLGIMFSLMLALAFIFLSMMPTGVMSGQAVSILWGSIFGLDLIDFIILITLNLIIILILIVFYKEFLAIMFNKKVALASGINVNFFNFLILCLTALVVSFSLKIVGALLVYALIVNPTSSAYQFIYSTKKLFIVSPIFGIISALAGVFLSLAMDFPIGSSIIIASCLIFVISIIISPKRRKTKYENQTETNQTSLLQQNKPRQREFFDKHAENWDSMVHHDSKKIDIILNMLELKPNHHVLDVGSGTGVLIPYLSNIINLEGQITAIDFSQKMIEVAQKKHPIETYPNIVFSIQDVNNMNIVNHYNAAICYSCFPHFQDKQKVIKKLTQSLQKGGRLLIAHSNSREFINNLHKKAGEEVSEDNLPPISVISEMIKKSGLQIKNSLDNEEMFFICAEKS